MTVVPEAPTCWTLIQRAVEGSAPHRQAFARRYLPLVRSFLAHRWGGWPIAQQLEDAVQDVFVECFRPDGPLVRAEPGRGLRRFLRGTALNVARRYEERALRSKRCTPTESTFLCSLPGREAQLSRVFDRRWARKLLVEALRLAKQRAQEADAGTRRRYELLRLRFEDNLPIRSIAERWNLPPRQVHDAYSRARREYYRALRDVVALHEMAPGRNLDQECRQLLDVVE